MNVIRRWLARRRGHDKPTPPHHGRLVLLTDYPWPTYLRHQGMVRREAQALPLSGLRPVLRLPLSEQRT